MTASSAESPPDGTAGEVTESFDTSLGRIALTAPRGDMAGWRAIVERAACQIGGTWGRGSTIAVRVCDDATFAALAPDLDAGTAAVTTSDGVFLGPALSRDVTETGRAVIVGHELTHARLGHAGDDRTQWWLKEGIAEWSAVPIAPGVSDAARWPQLGDALCTGRVTSAPPSGADIGSELGYEWAHAYVTYLVELLGEDAVMSHVRDRPEDATGWATRATAHAALFVSWLRQHLHSSC